MDDDEIPKHRSRKNRRDWCGGKKGVQHEGQPFLKYLSYTRNPKTPSGVELCCKTCAKQLEYWSPWWSDGARPSWVPKKFYDEILLSWEERHPKRVKEWRERDAKND